MNATNLYGTTQAAAARALIGADVLADNRNDLYLQILVALANRTGGGSGGSGTVTAFAFTNGAGITGTVTTPNTTPTLTLTLGAITPTTVNGLALLPVLNGFNISGGSGSSKTLVVSNSLTFQGTDGSSLNIGAGGTLGTAAFTAASAYVPAASVTGGGVIATGGFTLTVPATGTAALLGAANVFTAGQTVSGASLTLSGNQSAAAWTTTGIRLIGVPGTLTDTSSSGTVAAAYTDKLGGNTIAASNATTFTNYISAYFSAPTAGTNVTFTQKWGCGTDYFTAQGNGAAGQPTALFSGTPYTAGTATSNKPAVLIEPTGTTSNAWSTAGTMIGVNAASGFTGRLASFQLAGVEKAYIRQDGAIASITGIGCNNIYDSNLNVVLGAQANIGGANGYYWNALQISGPWSITNFQSLSGAGAVNLSTTVTKFTSTGAAQALTLADGTDGQQKIIVHVAAGGTGVLTPTTKSGFTTITFTNVGDNVTLQFATTIGWFVRGSRGAIVA